MPGHRDSLKDCRALLYVGSSGFTTPQYLWSLEHSEDLSITVGIHSFVIHRFWKHVSLFYFSIKNYFCDHASKDSPFEDESAIFQTAKMLLTKALSSCQQVSIDWPSRGSETELPWLPSVTMDDNEYGCW